MAPLLRENDLPEDGRRRRRRRSYHAQFSRLKTESSIHSRTRIPIAACLAPHLPLFHAGHSVLLFSFSFLDILHKLTVKGLGLPAVDSEGGIDMVPIGVNILLQFLEGELKKKKSGQNRTCFLV